MYTFLTIVWLSSAGVPLGDSIEAQALVRMPVGTVLTRTELRPALVEVCREWELLGPHEERFVNPENFQTDIDAVRMWYAELRDAPYVKNCEWLPSAEICRLHVNGCVEDTKALERRAAFELDRSSQIHGVISQLRADEAFWRLVGNTRCEWIQISQRRAYLSDLRQLVGPDKFDQGLLE